MGAVRGGISVKTILCCANIAVNAPLYS